jgi:hypothetical protein
VRVPVGGGQRYTSGLAAVNALRTGWTDRQAGAQGVLLVTGHPQPGSQGPDWDAIAAVAASGITLVVYMGVQRAPEIVLALRRHLPASLPAAAVQHASTARRSTQHAGHAARRHGPAGIGSGSAGHRSRACCQPGLCTGCPGHGCSLTLSTNRSPFAIHAQESTCPI